VVKGLYEHGQVRGRQMLQCGGHDLLIQNLIQNPIQP
jgi:hypothetical protein